MQPKSQVPTYFMYNNTVTIRQDVEVLNKTGFYLLNCRIIKVTKK